MKDINYFKAKLEEEKRKIEEELSETSIKNPKNKNDWEAVLPTDGDEREPDPNEAADNLEDYEAAFSVTDVLEARLLDINNALDAIKNGTYGKCNVGGTVHDIEEDRLEANPASITCTEHLK
ncbi:MAG: hypothetical protein UT05_C0010G0044 [Parcubacteria group bacterium GW2011_GWF2_38_76]|nr:MAG: hypothetical protein UT05_C0010G0044 [Parcubacteria group bacterium GW2011_GWF2_38_76]HBM45525.1 hypothetical protein [Patescibacteria group bacterium]